VHLCIAAIFATEINKMKTWHEDDEFWETMAPTMFGAASWDVAPAEIDQILELLDLEPDANILDLCCGPGRHSLELARRDYQVTGVDRTNAYLEKAGAQAKNEGLSVEFVLEDMRDFRRPEAFDGALMMFTSFGYFKEPSENQQVLENVARSLREGGALIIDMMGKEVLARIFNPRDWREIENGFFFLQERRINHNWSWIENRWILLCNDERYEVEVSHWLYSATELTTMLKQAGFSMIDIYGDLEGAPYDHVARRLVAVARK
jgi:SAM-dependent methyltransferase